MEEFKQLFYPKDENIVLSDLDTEGNGKEFSDSLFSLWRKGLVFAYWDNKVNKVFWRPNKDVKIIDKAEDVQPLKPNTCNNCGKEIDPLFDELISGLCDACRNKGGA